MELLFDKHRLRSGRLSQVWYLAGWSVHDREYLRLPEWRAVSERTRLCFLQATDVCRRSEPTGRLIRYSRRRFHHSSFERAAANRHPGPRYAELLSINLALS